MAEDREQEDGPRKFSERAQQLDRRSFLKKAAGGIAGLGTAAMIPGASGLQIKSGNGLEYFKSGASDSRFQVDSSGRLNVDRIGSSSEPVSSIDVQEIHGESSSLNITVYEDESGQAKAVTENKTYTGTCIFDAAQKAVDQHISSEKGNFDLHVKTGEYDLTEGLIIDEDHVERVRIASSGLGQVKLNTQEIDSDSYDSTIEINPGPVQGGDWQERAKAVVIEGFKMTDAGRGSREINGIYVNDTTHISINRNHMKGGFKRGLYLRNCWQGEVNSIEVGYCGSNSAGTPGIQVGHYDDTETHQAINHIQFNHLQGQVDEYAYFEQRGKATRIDINFPNVEFLAVPGFVFDKKNNTSGTQMNAQIRGPKLTGGAPAVETKGIVPLEVTGGTINADSSAIRATDGGAKINVSGTHLSGKESPVVNASGSTQIAVSGCRIRGGTVGVKADGMQSVNISGSTFQSNSKSGVKIVHSNYQSGNPHSLTGLNMIGVASNSENPVTIINTDDVSIGNVSASVNSDRSSQAVVKIEDSGNVGLKNIVPGENTSGELTTSGSVTLRRNSGTANLSDGDTVEHGLAEQPSKANIRLKTGSSNRAYVKSVDSTNITVALENPSGTAVNSDESIYWKAELG